MAIHGYYQHDDTPPAPYILAQVYLPALRLHADIEFLVDTGADGTSLLPYDVGRMGIQMSSVKGRYQTANGVGGETRSKKTEAILRFHDTAALGGFREIEIAIDLIAGKTDAQLPSLLGRDILNQFRCTFDAVNERVALELP